MDGALKGLKCAARPRRVARRSSAEPAPVSIEALEARRLLSTAVPPLTLPQVLSKSVTLAWKDPY
jgi:hypothetical protein